MTVRIFILSFLVMMAVEFAGSKSPSNQCKCTDYQCGCCTLFSIPFIDVHDNFCLDLSWRPGESGVGVKVRMNKKTIFNQTVISAKDPPPVCPVWVQSLLIFSLGVCVTFEHMVRTKTRLSGCAEFDVSGMGRDLIVKDLGCFHMGKQ